MIRQVKVVLYFITMISDLHTIFTVTIKKTILIHTDFPFSQFTFSRIGHLLYWPLIVYFHTILNLFHAKLRFSWSAKRKIWIFLFTNFQTYTIFTLLIIKKLISTALYFIIYFFYYFVIVLIIFVSDNRSCSVVPGIPP